MAHWPDVGGSLERATRDIYSEGVQFPFVKIYKAGKIDKELESMIKANVRFPERAMGDFRAQIAEDHPRLLLTTGTIAEVGFVLTRFYRVPRETVVDILITLLQRSNISVHQLDTAIVIQALMMCRPSGRVAFADAMLWAAARSSGTGATVYTLDKRFPSFGIGVRSEL